MNDSKTYILINLLFDTVVGINAELINLINESSHMPDMGVKKIAETKNKKMELPD